MEVGEECSAEGRNEYLAKLMERKANAKRENLVRENELKKEQKHSSYIAEHLKNVCKMSKKVLSPSQIPVRKRGRALVLHI